MTTDDTKRERNLQLKVYGLFLQWGLDHDRAVDLLDEIAAAGMTFTNSFVETQSEPKTYPGEPNLYSKWVPDGSGGETYLIDSEPGGQATATSDPFVAKTFADLGVIDQVRVGHSDTCKRLWHQHGSECAFDCPTCRFPGGANQKV